MSSLVADTHAVLWSLYERGRLPKDAQAAFEQAAAAGDPVFLSAISIVEVRYLVEKFRLSAEVLDGLLRAIDAEDGRLSVVSVDLDIARMMHRIPRELVPDMPDRIIAATALHLDLPLVTGDARIRSSPITTIW